MFRCPETNANWLFHPWNVFKTKIDGCLHDVGVNIKHFWKVFLPKDSDFHGRRQISTKQCICCANLHIIDKFLSKWLFNCCHWIQSNIISIWIVCLFVCFVFREVCSPQLGLNPSLRTEMWSCLLRGATRSPSWCSSRSLRWIFTCSPSATLLISLPAVRLWWNIFQYVTVSSYSLFLDAIASPCS